MAYTWDWKEDYIGRFTEPSRMEDAPRTVCNLFTGNGLFIAVCETEEEYCMHFFACDEDHLKNMINDSSIDFGELEFTLNYGKNKYNNTKINKIIKLLSGKSNINIRREGDFIKRWQYTGNGHEGKELD